MEIDEFREKLLRIYHPMIIQELFELKENSFRIKTIDEPIVVFKSKPTKELIKILRIWLKYLYKYKILKWFINEYGNRVKGQISIKRIVEGKTNHTDIEFFGNWLDIEIESKEELIVHQTDIQELKGNTFAYKLEQILDEIIKHAKID